MKSTSPYSINIARLCFLIVSVLGGIAIAASTSDTEYRIPIWVGTIGGVIISAIVIYLETLSRSFTLRGFSTATFGLMIGIICAWLLNLLPMKELLTSLFVTPSKSETLFLLYRILTYVVLAFLGISISLRSGQEDFAFIIPYIRFRQTNASEQLLLLDATTVVDSRLTPLLESGALEGRMIIPRYVLDEIKVLADSPSNGKRERGERALAMLERLREHKSFKLSVHDNDDTSAADPLDVRLAKTAQVTSAKLITTDDALTKTARLQGIAVMNLDEVAQAFKPMVNIGEKMKLAITRPGKEDHQGVGYLSDGSMIVVNHALQHMGTTQSIVVISKLQTNSGLMVFAELE